MQHVIIDKPYQFVPPLESNFWPSVMQMYLPHYLRKKWGVHSVECRHTERLTASVKEGHGILLTPNHCRLTDPFVLGYLSRKIKKNFFAMASWHLFNQDWFTTFIIRRLGAFSVYREGMDRTAVNAAIKILAEAHRPLIVFPEGGLSRHNDRLNPLLDGVALMARKAAKQRASLEPAGKVVVHPIAIRYFFQGNLKQTVEPILADIEARLSWQPEQEQLLHKRVERVAEALLTLKEIEYLGHGKQGKIYERVAALIDYILLPLEEEWNVGNSASNISHRVKRLRTAILPDLIGGDISEEERQRRWKQLSDIYLAQALSNYPQDYVTADDPVPEHLLETIERFEEDLTDEVPVNGPMHAVIDVGTPIEVSTQRGPKGEADPVISGIESQLTEMLEKLSTESAKANSAGQ